MFQTVSARNKISCVLSFHNSGASKIHKVDQKSWSDKHIMDMPCTSVHKSFLSRVLLRVSIVLKYSRMSTLLKSGLLVIIVGKNKNEK